MTGEDTCLRVGVDIIFRDTDSLKDKDKDKDKVGTKKKSSVALTDAVDCSWLLIAHTGISKANNNTPWSCVRSIAISI